MTNPPSSDNGPDETTHSDLTAFGNLHASKNVPRLQPLTAALLECITPAEAVRVVVERGIAVLGAHAGLVTLITRDGRELEIIRTSGYAPDIIDKWGRFPINGPYPLSEVVKGGGAIYMGDRADWGVRYPALAGDIQDSFQASVSLPLAARQRVFGAMHFSFLGELQRLHRFLR